MNTDPNNSGTDAVITIFWSWQLDSKPQDNRNFIEDCLDRAVKQLKKANAILINVDRDTKGVGGTPGIADTILSKIRSSDIFIWDATLVYEKPRPAPNPNVLFELGYSIAIMGEGRLIGVMNTSGRPGAKELPFDLKHRRWPIQYSLSLPNPFIRLIGKVFPRILNSYKEKRQVARKELTDSLAQAIKDALLEQKLGAIHSDVDLYAAKSLWKVINSTWMWNWHERRKDYPQYEESIYLDEFGSYIQIAQLPENAFHNEIISKKHENLIAAISNYMKQTSQEMVLGSRTGIYVISTKTTGKFLNDYDERYERQIQIITETADVIWATWSSYVNELRTYYPEITSTDTVTT